MAINVETGEHVLHAQHGVGEITSIRRRSFCGHAAATYVKLHFERDELTMTVLEEELPHVVRELISSEQARELLGRITDWDEKPRAQWKARVNAHQAAIDSGDPFEYVKVLKGLAHLNCDSELRSSDRAHFNESLSLLTEELSCVLNQSPKRVHTLLTEAVGASL